MYEDLVGKELCGCTVVEILPSEGSGTMALVDTHCPKCGVHKVRLRNLLTKQKSACPHAAYLKRKDEMQDNMRHSYERMMRDHAEEWLGRDDGTFHIHEIVTDVPFTPKPLRTYVRVTCLNCGNEQVIDAQRIGKTKCTRCARRASHKHGGITVQYPKLYDSLKSHWRKCYFPSCDGYYKYGGKGWHFDERWIRYENGKPMLNASVAIADCLEAGWDENDSRMILEKDKLAIELGERVIGRQTVRCVDRSENSLYHFDN